MSSCVYTRNFIGALTLNQNKIGKGPREGGSGWVQRWGYCLHHVADMNQSMNQLLVTGLNCIEIILQLNKYNSQSQSIWIFTNSRPKRFQKHLYEAFKAPLLLCLSNSRPNSAPKKNIISKTIDAKSGLRIAVAHPGTEL